MEASQSELFQVLTVEVTRGFALNRSNRLLVVHAQFGALSVLGRKEGFAILDRDINSLALGEAGEDEGVLARKVSSFLKRYQGGTKGKEAW